MSVLTDMRDSIKTQKQLAATGLTPTLDERASLPNDAGMLMSNEALINHARELRKFAADAIAIADALDLMASSSTLNPSAPAPDSKAAKADAQKEREQEGDRKALEREAAAAAEDGGFAADYAAKAKAAQDAAFTRSEEKASEVEGWVCDEHGADFTVKTSRSGTRTYRQCNQCKEFER